MDVWETDKGILISKLQSLSSPEQLDEISKLKLLTLLENVTAKVQTPRKFVQCLTQDGNKLVMARVAIAMGVFDAFAANDFASMSTEVLSTKTRGDQSLLARIMRMLAVYKLVERSGASTWTLTQMGAMLVSGTPAAMAVIHYYYMSKCHANLLEFLESTNFQEPNDYYKSPWGYAWNTDKGYFGWLSSGDQLRSEAFNTLMAQGQVFRGQAWFEFYPVDRLRTSADRVMLVDIGGGIGHNVISFKGANPHLSGSIVLQDLPHVIEAVPDPLPSGVEKQAYDMFTPQPIRGAKTYYLRNILHDWPDKQCRQILNNVRAAMAEDSVLILNENVIDEQNLSRMTADPDFIMMNAFAALERTEKQWRTLIQSAGFRLLEVWKPTEPSMMDFALFEAVLM